MHLVSLAVTDFRNLASTLIEPDPEGTTVITGLNGAGKTSLLEATAYLATLQSFRGSPKEALVRRGADSAILRAETRVDDRTLTIEAEIQATGRSRTQVNRQAVRRRGDLHEALRVTVFSPEDIGVVRAGPADRRRFLDDTLAVVDPKAARSAEEVDKVLRQRAALLRNSGRTLRAETAVTLDVWDSRLDESGSRLVEAREQLVVQLTPLVADHYARLAGARTEIGMRYVRSWTGPLLEALAAARDKDVQRGVSTVGPAPRRSRTDPDRTAVEDPRLPGRAAVVGLGAAAGRPPTGHRTPRHGARAPARRRLLGVGPRAIAGPARGTAAGSDHAHHRPAGAARGGRGQGLRHGRRRPRGGHRRAGVSPEPPHRRNSEPRPLDGSLEALSRQLGMEGAVGVGRLFAGWSDIVGEAMAEHVQPVRMDRSSLVVTVDHPAWATQVKRLGDTLLDRASAYAGVDRPGRLEVRVQR